MFDTNAEELIDSAILVVVGMAVVFVGLSILMVASMIMIKIFRPKEAKPVKELSPPWLWGWRYRWRRVI
jgi:Na+-transporting methylmalonyl-CoA/oxaloacetate decarboxylase gamma subunit